MRSFHIPAVLALLAIGLPTQTWAQTANSSSGAGSATQSSSGGATGASGNPAPGTANGQSAGQQSFPAGGAAGGGATGQSKIGAPTPTEVEEQRKSDKDTQICKGC